MVFRRHIVEVRGLPTATASLCLLAVVPPPSITTARRVDLEQRGRLRPEAPGPLPLAVLLVPGLVDLLDHVGLVTVGQEERASAGRPGVEEVVGGGRGEHLGREQLARVRGVSGLTAGLPPLSPGRGPGPGGLDEI